MSSRYVTFSQPLYASLVVLAAAAAMDLAAPARLRAASWAIFLILAGAILAANVRGHKDLQWRRQYLAEARDELFRLEDDKLLRRLYVDPKQLREEFLPLFRKHRLAMFRDAVPFAQE